MLGEVCGIVGRGMGEVRGDVAVVWKCMKVLGEVW